METVIREYLGKIKVVNKSARRVLILDGEELVGAKQNRIVNTTIIVGAHSTTVIPVSCVEQGRWAYEGDRFRSEERLMSAELRAVKARQVRSSVRATGEFRADQGALWDEIGVKAARDTVRMLVTPNPGSWSYCNGVFVLTGGWLVVYLPSLQALHFIHLKTFSGGSTRS